MLVTCDGGRFLIGANSEGVQAIISLGGEVEKSLDIAKQGNP
jgi:hypothetical protein